MAKGNVVVFELLLIITIIALLFARSNINGKSFATISTSTTTASTTTILIQHSGTLNASEQQQGARQNGLNLTSSFFTCGSSQDCEVVLTAPCNNNLPGQYACINKAYYQDYRSIYNSSMRPTPCPLFIAAYNITCACDYRTNTCVEDYSSP